MTIFGHSQIRRNAVALSAGLAILTAAPVVAQDAASITGEQWARTVWQDALAGNADDAFDLIGRLGANGDAGAAELRAALEQRNSHLEAADETRLARIEEVHAEMVEHDENDDLLEALRDAVEIHTLSTDKAAALADPTIQDIVQKASAAARRAEANGKWLEAHELFYRLNLLYEQEGTYREDTRRLGSRLGMLRLYTPKLLHDLRNERRIAEELDELPPYNALGDSWQERLDGVNQAMVIRAINRAQVAHVEGADMAEMLIAGLQAIRTLVTTSDIAAEFQGLGDERKATEFVVKLNDGIAKLEQRKGRAGYFDLTQTMAQLTRDNERTVQLPDEALLHEFGNGAISVLDDFTSIIWPDEIRQFQRSTEGRFTGVGIQINFDDAQQLYVVTPLEGTPAQRAGIRTGDLIRAIDGVSTLGITSSQAVEKITGPKGTEVTLTIEREGLEDTFDVDIERDVIPIYSVKGWRREGVKETDWDWFIDPANGIGYVRLTQFSEDSTRELRDAVRQMQQEGLEGLILDLRFNPGGLLNQAVGVANIFVDHGTIVSQHDSAGVERDAQRARAGLAMIEDLPVAVLVNEGTASASEIVSGCLQDYGKAVVVGARSFGKGSVQNVYDISRGEAALRLTTQYYRLPGGRLIHRRVGDQVWGVEPDVVVNMTPQQISDSLVLRQDADVLAIDENGDVLPDEERPDPETLLTEGIDTQLETALLLIRSQVVGRTAGQAAVMLEPKQVVPGG